MGGMRWMLLVAWLGLCFTVAGVSARWTAVEIPGWYRTLARPVIAPPNWVFGPVWTLLYALMAIAAWRVSMADPSRWRIWGLGLFLLQLALNFAWSWIFFRRHELGAALVEVVILWAAIGATTLAFARVSPLAAWLMAPYLAWVTFASVLNGAFWRLNRA
jgi:tryptophan-rich sensory protein